MISYTLAFIGYITPMKKKECPSCAMMIDEDAINCPVCGYEYPQPNRLYQIMALILILIFLLMYIL